MLIAQTSFTIIFTTIAIVGPKAGKIAKKLGRFNVAT
jgi:glycine cleavage system aminomethyltransferase T